MQAGDSRFGVHLLLSPSGVVSREVVQEFWPSLEAVGKWRAAATGNESGGSSTWATQAVTLV